MNLYIMRHGETDWNTVRRIQGTTDIPLNQRGIDMTIETSENVFRQGIVFDRIYTSPLQRAVKTAEIMNAHSGCPVIKDNRITEFNFGEGEGHTLSELMENPKYKNIVCWFTDPSNYRAEYGTESFDSLFGRTRDFLDSEIIPLENKCKNVLITCHGGITRSFIHVLSNGNQSDFAAAKIPNCGINCFSLTDGKFTKIYTARKFYEETGETLSDYNLSK